MPRAQERGATKLQKLVKLLDSKKSASDSDELRDAAAVHLSQLRFGSLAELEHALNLLANLLLASPAWPTRSKAARVFSEMLVGNLAGLLPKEDSAAVCDDDEQTGALLSMAASDQLLSRGLTDDNVHLYARTHGVQASSAAAASGPDAIEAAELCLPAAERAGLARLRQRRSAAPGKRKKRQRLLDDSDEGAATGRQDQAAGGWTAVQVEYFRDARCCRSLLARALRTLADQLRSAAWEARHGAALALCCLLAKLRAAGSERVQLLVSAAQSEDLCVRLLELLVCDRFSDFVDDLVVLPVRDTAAQALAVALAPASSYQAAGVAWLVQLAGHRQCWEVRYTAFAALEYLLVTATAAAASLLATAPLQRLCAACCAALTDRVEDVRARAAQTLAAALGAQQLDSAQLSGVYAVLWKALHIDDALTSAAAALMQLLCALLQLSSAGQLIAEHTPKHYWRQLRPLLGHGLVRVRTAVASACQLLLASVPEVSGRDLRDILGDVFQAMLAERDEAAFDAMLQVSRAAEGILLAAHEHRSMQRYALPPGRLLELAPVGGVLFFGGCQQRHCLAEALACNVLLNVRIAGLDAAAFLRERLGAAGSEPDRRQLLAFVWLRLVQRTHADHDRPTAVATAAAALALFAERLADTSEALLADHYRNVAQAQLTAAHYLQPVVRLCPQLSAPADQQQPAAFLDRCRAVLAADVYAELQQQRHALQDSAATKGRRATPLSREAERKRSVLLAFDQLSDAVQSWQAAKQLTHAAVMFSFAAATAAALHTLGNNDCEQTHWHCWRCLLTSYEQLASAQASARTTPDEQHWLRQRIAGTAAQLLHDAEPASRGRMLDCIAELVPTADRAAVYAALAEHFGAALFEQLPRLRDCLDAWHSEALAVVAALAKHAHPALGQHFERLLADEQLLALLERRHSDDEERWSAAVHCLHAYVGSALLGRCTVEWLVLQLLPRTEAASAGEQRCNAMRALLAVLDRAGDAQLLPYCGFFVAPLLASMNDRLFAAVRAEGARVFARLVDMLPLEPGAADPDGCHAALSARRPVERRFIEQLVGGAYRSSLPALPFATKLPLRSYQLDGVAWLSFLHRFRLHGVLADDMGLGKTVMTACALALDQHARRAANSPPRSSLIVVPGSLGPHWLADLAKFLPDGLLTAALYSRAARPTLLPADGSCPVQVLVASYGDVKRDVALFAARSWAYLVLDEGHVINSPKSKTSAAMKQLTAVHRLVLTGTPLQNHVVDLWSLFDFLMPGYLGDCAAFQRNVARPIEQSRRQCDHPDVVAHGDRLLAQLHRQMLPFILRREKHDVLHELPAKNIQDVLCTPSPLQRCLLAELSDRPQAFATPGDAVASVSKQLTADAAFSLHTFARIHHSALLATHPALLLPKMHNAARYLASLSRHTDLQSLPVEHWRQSGKLVALVDLLRACRIGVDDDGDGDGDGDDGLRVQQRHRAVIFAQHRATLDLLENSLLRVQLPDVVYSRLDAALDAQARHAVVDEFNRDASIDCLLTTTKIGGLGLNLTGADTVVFVEHDWNPMVDLQAMDRAHRIGQTRSVNVYRLITQDTVEQDILSVQRFKLHVANSVVNEENAQFQQCLSDTSSLFAPAEEPAAPVGGDGNDPTQDQLNDAAQSLNIADQSEYGADLGAAAFLGRCQQFNG